MLTSRAWTPRSRCACESPVIAGTLLPRPFVRLRQYIGRANGAIGTDTVVGPPTSRSVSPDPNWPITSRTSVAVSDSGFVSRPGRPRSKDRRVLVAGAGGRYGVQRRRCLHCWRHLPCRSLHGRAGPGVCGHSRARWRRDCREPEDCRIFVSEHRG